MKVSALEVDQIAGDPGAAQAAPGSSLAVLVVQQVESNLLQPFVVARAVSVHPLVILLAVTTGAILGGVAGAVIAVPIAAVAVRVGEYLRECEQPA